MIAADQLLSILSYIENNIANPITAEVIARQFGYSQYHFAKIFRNQTGSSIMKYVITRRLIYASEEIRCGSKIIDVAIKYQFETHRGFTKAFYRQFGYSPCVLKSLYYQHNYLMGGVFAMEQKNVLKRSVHDTKEQLFDILLKTMNRNGIQFYTEDVENAYQLSCRIYKGLKRYSGDEYVVHALNTAIILSEFEAETNVILAGLFCDAYQKCGIDLLELSGKLPIKTVEILRELADKTNSISDDTLLVWMSEWLHNMRTLEYMEPSQRIIKARQTMDDILPLCSRIQNKDLQKELRDHAEEYIRNI